MDPITTVPIAVPIAVATNPAIAGLIPIAITAAAVGYLALLATIARDAITSGRLLRAEIAAEIDAETRLAVRRELLDATYSAVVASPSNFLPY